MTALLGVGGIALRHARQEKACASPQCSLRRNLLRLRRLRATQAAHVLWRGAEAEYLAVAGTNTDPNAAATTVQVRAERCGSDKGGRIYDINLTCGNTDGSTATIDVPVVVPHNKPKHTH